MRLIQTYLFQKNVGGNLYSTIKADIDRVIGQEEAGATTLIGVIEQPKEVDITYLGNGTIVVIHYDLEYLIPRAVEVVLKDDSSGYTDNIGRTGIRGKPRSLTIQKELGEGVMVLAATDGMMNFKLAKMYHRQLAKDDDVEILQEYVTMLWETCAQSKKVTESAVVATLRRWIDENQIDDDASVGILFSRELLATWQERLSIEYSLPIFDYHTAPATYHKGARPIAQVKGPRFHYGAPSSPHSGSSGQPDRFRYPGVGAGKAPPKPKRFVYTPKK